MHCVVTKCKIRLMSQRKHVAMIYAAKVVVSYQLGGIYSDLLFSHMAFESRFAGPDTLSLWPNPIWLPLEALGRLC